MNLQLQIKSEYAAMSKASRKLADFLMTNPAGFLSMSAIEIGEQSSTSSATVIRFSRQLGFKSLEELKICVAQQLDELAEPETLDSVIQESDTPEQLSRKLSQLITDTIQLLTHQLDFSQLERAIHRIKHSGMVYLYGIGTSGAAACDLYLKLNRADIRANYTADAHLGIEFSVHMKPSDTAVIFSYSGRTREVLLAAQQAKANGATVIAITRNQASPLSRLADILLTVPDNEHLLRIGALASKYSSMMMVDLLFLGCVQKDLDSVEKGIHETSQLLTNFKERDAKSVKTGTTEADN